MDEGGGREGGREHAHKSTMAQLLSLRTVGSIAINYRDLLHLLITKLFLLPTIAELFLNYSTLQGLIYNARASGSHCLTQRFTIPKPEKTEATCRAEISQGCGCQSKKELILETKQVQIPPPPPGAM